MPKTQGESEAIVLVKAAPQISQKHGETVCCAAITPEGEWVRLYPVTFRKLEDSQQFGRWDRIKFKWSKPNDDHRPESCRIDQNSIEIIGELAKSEREKLLAKLEVTGLSDAIEKGKSLALLRPRNVQFFIESKSAEEIEEERIAYESVLKQKDLFESKVLLPLKPCPYKFKYKYTTDDGEREGTCQDWEVHATFFNWRRNYGEEQTLARMRLVFGEDYPKKGMVFAMGTHSMYPKTWLINAIIRMDEVKQLSLL
jgi:hypothetical protein